MHAVEADPDAFAWASRNCSGTGVDLRLGDMADAFPELDGAVDVVVSNPPYIPAGAVIRDPEVATHDPALALWSGADGLDAMRVVETVAARLLRPGRHGRGGARRPAGPARHRRSSGRPGGGPTYADHRDRVAGRDRYVAARRQ